MLSKWRSNTALRHPKRSGGAGNGRHPSRGGLALQNLRSSQQLRAVAAAKAPEASFSEGFSVAESRHHALGEGPAPRAQAQSLHALVAASPALGVPTSSASEGGAAHRGASSSASAWLSPLAGPSLCLGTQDDRSCFSSGASAGRRLWGLDRPLDTTLARSMRPPTYAA